MKNKKLIITSIILIFLMLIGVFRWQTLAEKTMDSRVLKWKQNIITGERILETYSTRGLEVEQFAPGDDYSIFYFALLILALLILTIELVKNRKVDK